MSLINRVDLKKVQDNPSIKIFFLIWFSFCIITIFAFYFQIRALAHIDVPTHIGAGLVISAFVFSTVKVKNGRQALALCFIPFLLWEFIEIGISSNLREGTFLFRLFEENFANQIQDVTMDILGFLVFMIMTGRRM